MHHMDDHNVPVQVVYLLYDVIMFKVNLMHTGMMNHNVFVCVYIIVHVYFFCYLYFSDSLFSFSVFSVNHSVCDNK